MEHVKIIFIGLFVLTLISGIAWGGAALVCYLATFYWGKALLTIVGVAFISYFLGYAVKDSIE